MTISPLVSTSSRRTPTSFPSSITWLRQLSGAPNNSGDPWCAKLVNAGDIGASAVRLSDQIGAHSMVACGQKGLRNGLKKERKNGSWVQDSIIEKRPLLTAAHRVPACSRSRLASFYRLSSSFFLISSGKSNGNV
jgi:hypothetical protein